MHLLFKETLLKCPSCHMGAGLVKSVTLTEHQRTVVGLLPDIVLGQWRSSVAAAVTRLHQDGATLCSLGRR